MNDFLDITRIESGRQVITKAPVDLDKLFQNAVADLKPLADEKNIALQYQPPPATVPEVFGDRNLVEQVLINLISNAIKYSPKGAWARVSVAQRNGQTAVSVQDNGLGIPKESVSRLFEKFYRVRNDDRKTSSAPVSGYRSRSKSSKYTAASSAWSPSTAKARRSRSRFRSISKGWSRPRRRLPVTWSHKRC